MTGGSRASPIEPRAFGNARVFAKASLVHNTERTHAERLLSQNLRPWASQTAAKPQLGVIDLVSRTASGYC